MSKTKPTKKTSVVIDWPTGHFTITDVQKKYPSIVNITLRFRVKKALDAKEIVNIGKIKPAIGRPKLVFTRANATKEVLEAATAAGVLPMEDRTTVPVAEVKTSKQTSASVANTETTTSTATSATQS